MSLVWTRLNWGKADVVATSSRQVFTRWARKEEKKISFRMLLKLGTGNGERETGNGKRETRNGKPGTGVWERVHTGNPPKNSTWWTKEKKREQFGERWGRVTVVNVSFYRLCPQMTGTFLLKQSPIGTGINTCKARNGAWGENRINIITCYPNRSGHSRS